MTKVRLGKKERAMMRSKVAAKQSIINANMNAPKPVVAPLANSHDRLYANPVFHDPSWTRKVRRVDK